MRRRQRTWRSAKRRRALGEVMVPLNGRLRTSSGSVSSGSSARDEAGSLEVAGHGEILGDAFLAEAVQVVVNAHIIDGRRRRSGSGQAERGDDGDKHEVPALVHRNIPSSGASRRRTLCILSEGGLFYNGEGWIDEMADPDGRVGRVYSRDLYRGTSTPVGLVSTLDPPYLGGSVYSVNPPQARSRLDYATPTNGWPSAFGRSWRRDSGSDARRTNMRGAT